MNNTVDSQQDHRKQVNQMTPNLLKGLLSLAFLSICITLSNNLADKSNSIYLLAGALTLIWTTVSLSIWERKLINRRLWINQVINPESRLYPLIKGGLVLAILSLVYALLPSFFILLSLTQLHVYEWIVIFLIFALKLVLVQHTEKRLAKHLVGTLTPYIARHLSGIFLIVMTVLALGAVHVYALPQAEIKGGLVGVKAMVENDLADWQGNVLYPILQLTTYTDYLYIWALSDQVPPAQLDQILRYLLIILFVIHQVVFVIVIQRVFDGIMIALDLDRRKDDLNQLDLSKSQGNS